MTDTFDHPDDRRSRLRRAIDAVLAETPPPDACRRSRDRARRIGLPVPRKWYTRPTHLLLVAAVAATVLLGSMFATDRSDSGLRPGVLVGTGDEPGGLAMSDNPFGPAIVPFPVRPPGSDIDSAGNEIVAGMPGDRSGGWTRVGIEGMPTRIDPPPHATGQFAPRPATARREFLRLARAWSATDEVAAACGALIDATPDAEFAPIYGRTPRVSQDPDDGLPRAFALLALRQYEAAVSHLLPYVEAHPDEALLHRLLARSLAECGRHGRAAVHAELARALADGGSFAAAATEEARSLRRRVPDGDAYESLREALGPTQDDPPRNGVRVALTWSGLSGDADLHVTDADGRELPATRPASGGRHGPIVVTADSFPLEVAATVKKLGREPCAPVLLRVEIQRCGGPPVVRSQVVAEAGAKRAVATIRAVK